MPKGQSNAAVTKLATARVIIATHMGRIIEQDKRRILFELRPEYAISCIPALQRVGVVVFVGNEMRNGPPMRLIAGRWIEIPLPSFPGRPKVEVEWTPWSVYEIAVGKPARLPPGLAGTDNDKLKPVAAGEPAE